MARLGVYKIYPTEFKVLTSSPLTKSQSQPPTKTVCSPFSLAANNPSIVHGLYTNLAGTCEFFKPRPLPQIPQRQPLILVRILLRIMLNNPYPNMRLFQFLLPTNTLTLDIAWLTTPSACKQLTRSKPRQTMNLRRISHALLSASNIQTRSEGGGVLGGMRAAIVGGREERVRRVA